MQMPDDQQYFAVGTSEPVAPRPFWRTWKLGALIGGVVVLAGVAIFVMNAVQLGRDGKDDDVRDRLASALTACETARDPEACKARARSEVAGDAGDASLCDGMTGDAFASCVTLAAAETGQGSACAVLNAEERTACEDLAWKTLAEGALLMETCGKIVDRDLATACRTNVEQKAVAQGKCEAAGVDASRCAARQSYEMAVAAGTPEACAGLGDEEYRYICTLAIEDVDQDGDGLSVAEERRYGTSDTDPDSDNDGYDDGMEVANGFNPAE